MMKAAFIISIFFLLSAPVLAQKTVRKKTEPERVESTSTEKSSASDQAVSTQAVTKQLDAPLRILYKPRAAYPNQGKGAVCFQGTVILRVEFLESGQIGKIQVITALPFGATESSIEAARKIKFEPAQKNGKPITIFKIVEFAYTF